LGGLGAIIATLVGLLKWQKEIVQTQL
jgi:hypothetical protein